MSVEKLNGVTDQELVQRLLSKEREIVEARFRHAMSQLENTASLGVIRKDIARIKTEIRSREIAAGSPAGSLVSRHGKSGVQASSSGDSAPRGGFLQGIVDKIKGAE